MLGKKREPVKVGSDIYGVKSNWKTDQKTGNTGETGFRHSSYYHKYFRGYTEVRTETAKGGYKIQRFYTQPWQVQDVSPNSYILYRLFYVILVLAAACFFAFGATMDSAGNRSIPGVVGELASVLCLILLTAARRCSYTVLKRICPTGRSPTIRFSRRARNMKSGSKAADWSFVDEK